MFQNFDSMFLLIWWYMFASESVCQSVSPSFQTGSGVRHVWGVATLIPSSAIDCQQEMGNRLHWPVHPVQPIIPFPVTILWPNWVYLRGFLPRAGCDVKAFRSRFWRSLVGQFTFSFIGSLKLIQIRAKSVHFNGDHALLCSTRCQHLSHSLLSGQMSLPL